MQIYRGMLLTEVSLHQSVRKGRKLFEQLPCLSSNLLLVNTSYAFEYSGIHMYIRWLHILSIHIKGALEAQELPSPTLGAEL